MFARYEIEGMNISKAILASLLFMLIGLSYCMFMQVTCFLLLLFMTYNQVQPLRINYLASNHRDKIINY